MSHSNVYPFPTSSDASCSSPTTIYPRRPARSRALSLLSIDSARSGGTTTSLESQKAEPTVFASTSFRNHIACGSFVPNTPATAVLRTFLLSKVTHTRRRSRHASSHFEKEPESPCSPSSPVPFITRTLPPESDSGLPSHIKAYPTFPRVRRGSSARTRSEVYPSDLHPILAGLEQRSKFCAKKGTCSTCKRVGSGFPQCGRCGESWCSRECRLNGGKKHTCRIRST